MTYRDIAANETGIRNQVLERAQHQGLMLAVDEDSEEEMDEIEIIRQVKIIRAMAVPLVKKRYLRYMCLHMLSSYQMISIYFTRFNKCLALTTVCYVLCM